jgi:hypothetical protein
MSIHRRALAYYRPFLGQSLAATALTLALIPFNLLKPWPLAFVIAKILPKALAGSTEPIVIAGVSFAGWTVPQIIGLLCALMVFLHLMTGWLNLLAVMVYLRVGLHGLLKLRTSFTPTFHSLPAQVSRCPAERGLFVSRGLRFAGAANLLREGDLHFSDAGHGGEHARGHGVARLATDAALTRRGAVDDRHLSHFRPPDPEVKQPASRNAKARCSRRRRKG